MNDVNSPDMEKTAIGTLDADKTQAVATPQANSTQFAMSVECPVCRTPNPPSEIYCIDCGFMLSEQPAEMIGMPQQASMGKLVSPDGVREYPLKQGENSVGRENADVLLSDSSVSRSHAKITVSNGKTMITDLGSTNGTTIDGQKLDQGESVELTDGYEIIFGGAKLKYIAPEEEAVDIPADSVDDVDEIVAQTEPADEDIPDEQTTVTEEAIFGRLVAKDGLQSFDLQEKTYMIGRRAGANDIVISDPYCSGRHADLVVESGKIILTDIGSTNGTFVNGVRLDPNVPRELAVGDEITFGQAMFKFEVA